MKLGVKSLALNRRRRRPAPGGGGEPDTTAPTATSITLGTQQSNGNVPISMADLDENSTAAWVLTSSDQSGAANTAVKTAAEGGAALTDQVDFGTFSAASAGGIYNESLMDGLDGSYYLQVVFFDAAGNISPVYADGPSAIDTTAMTLSGASTTAGDTEIDVDWSTDEGRGTARIVAVPNGATAPTVTENLAGQESGGTAADADSGDITVSASGAQTTVTLTGLTNGTAYDVYIAHDDGFGNTDQISVLNTTPVAAAGYTPTTVTYDDSTFATAMNGGAGLTTGKAAIFAMRVTIPAGTSGLQQLLGPLDTSIYWLGNNFVFRAEGSGGAASEITGAVAQYPAGGTYSILAKAVLRPDPTETGISDMELYIDGSLVGSRSDSTGAGYSLQSWIRNTKLIQHINSGNGSTAYNGFDLIGGLWIGNSGYDDLTNLDFFDSSNNPIFNSATIDGHTAVFFQNGDAADWNARTNAGSDGGFTLTGTVT